jgi:hypothetical protein
VEFWVYFWSASGHFEVFLALEVFSRVRTFSDKVSCYLMVL